MMMKKILSLILVFALLASCMTIVYGDDTYESYEAEVFEPSTALQNRKKVLTALDILPEEIDYTAPVTRMDFACMVYDMMKCINIEKAEDEVGFTDINYSDSRGKKIHSVSKYGYFKGISETEFGWNETVTVYQGLVVMIRVLGYENMVNLQGGEPMDYRNAAVKFGLIGEIGVDSKEMTYLDVIPLLYNTLFAERYIIHRIVGDGMLIEEKAGDSILTGVHHASFIRGIMTDNGITSLDGHSEARENAIRIGNITIKTNGNADCRRYLGMTVDCLYRVEDSENVLICLYDSDNYNNVILVESDDLLLEGGSLYYINERDRKKQINISGSTDVIYNGSVYSTYTIEDLKVSEGYLNLIDNNNDGELDVIIAVENDTYNVASASDYTKKIRDRFRTSKELDLNDVKYVIYEGNNEIELSDIDINDVLSVQMSKDGTYCTIYVSKKTFNGRISELDGTDIYIDGVEYEQTEYFKELLDDGLCNPIKMGNTYTFALDVNGKIAAVLSTAGDEIYGFMVSLGLDNHFWSLNNTKIKIFTEAGQMVTYNFANKVKFNDVWITSAKKLYEYTGSASSKMPMPLYEDGSVKRQLVKYKLNTDGEVISILTAYDMSDSTDELIPDNYQGYDLEKFILNGVVSGSRYYGENTKVHSGSKYTCYKSSLKVFLVPYDDDSDDDDYAVTDRSYYQSGKTSTPPKTEIHDADEMFGASVNVVYTAAGSVTSTLNYQSPVMVIAENDRKVLNENGDAVTVITGYNRDNTYRIALADDDLADESAIVKNQNGDKIHQGVKLRDLPVGSVIRFILDVRGDLAEFYVLYNPEETYSTAATSPDDDFWCMRGDSSAVSGYSFISTPVINSLYNYYYKAKAIAVNPDGRFKFNSATDQTVAKQLVLSPTSISLRTLVVDEDEVTIGTVADIEPDDKLYMVVKFGYINLIVIYKN